MALSADQELLEYELRVEQMRTTIESGRLNIDKMRAEMRWENRKFAVQLVVGVAASVGAGVALANYVNSRPIPPAVPLPAPPPQIIYLVPSPLPVTIPPKAP